MKQPSAPLIIRKFAGLEVRETPQAQMVAVDVLKAIGQKNPNAAWSNIKKQYPEILQETCKYSKGRGRPVDVVTLRGAIKLAMLAKGPRATEFRNWTAKLVEGYESADPALTADLIDRTENPETLERLALRAKTKASVISLASTASQRGMRRRQDFAKLNDSNNVFVTSSTAKELQASRETSITRDSFTAIELATLDLLQVTQKQHIENTDAQGAGQILDRQEDVRSVLRPFRDQFLGKKVRPNSKGGLEPVLTVDV